MGVYSILLVLLFSFFFICFGAGVFWVFIWCPFFCGRVLDVKYSDSSFSGTPFLLFSMFKYFFTT